jgi:hypothetical protein
MRIAFAVFDDFPDSGAVGRRYQMLASGLASLGHEVHIIAPFKFSPGALTGEIDGVKLHWGAHLERNAANTTLARVRKRLSMYNTCRRLLRQGLDWLIKRLVKVGARVFYHARRWYVHIASAFPLAHHYRAVLARGS